MKNIILNLKIPILLLSFFLSTSFISKRCWSVTKFIPNRTDNRNSIQKIGKLNILNLYGTREEVAYQHGLYARSIVQKGESALNHYIPLLKNSILNATESSFSGKLYATYVDTILTSQFASDTIPQRDRYVYGALADGAGLGDVKDIYRAVLYPDMGLYLLGNEVKFENYDYVKHLPGYGCTTLIAKSSEHEGSELIGRNFDFASFGSFEKNASIIFVHPSEPEDQQYVMFTSLGLHSSHTTWNESGLFMSLHQLLVNENQTEGTYILGITDEVTRRAHNLKEAQHIIESHKITSSWRIIVHSTKEHRTLLADVSASHKVFKLIEDDIHFFTNHVFDNELSKKQYFFYYNFGWDSLSRYNFLKAKTADSSHLSQQQMIDLMSSHEHILSNKSVIQKHVGTIAKQSNLMSVIIDAGKNMVYFATPQNDFELSPNGGYQGVPLDFSMNWLSKAKVETPSILSSTHTLSQDFIQSEVLIRQAESQYEKRASLESILPLIQKAYLLTSGDVNVALLKSGMELRVYSNNNKRTDLLAAAKSTLLTLVSSQDNEDHSKHPIEIANLLLARVHVLNGEINLAFNILKNWKGETSPYLNEQASKDLRLLEMNKNNNTELQNIFKGSLKRLTFEFSDTDISTL